MIPLCPQEDAQWIVLCAQAGLTLEEYAVLTYATVRA